MRQITISLIIGIIAGATFLSVVPALSWLPLICTLAIGGASAKREWLRFIFLYLAVSAIGVVRTSQDIRFLKDALEKGAPTNPIVYRIQKFSEPLRTSLEDDIIALASDDGNTTATAITSSNESAAINIAMTLGDKRLLAPEIKDVYSRSGASHALALSGMHLAIVYAILTFFIIWIPRFLTLLPLFIMSRWKTGRRAQSFLVWTYKLMPTQQTIIRSLSIFVIITIWSYTLLVGMSASVMRAAVMLTITTLGMIMMRHVNLLQSLTLAAFLLLFINPLSIFDIGFQMSFLAVLGIAIYYRPLLQIASKITPWSKNFIVKAIVASVCLTISAQLLVMPLIAHYFGQIPVFGILTSLIVSVSATLIVWLGMLLIIVLLTMKMLPFLVFISTSASQYLMTVLSFIIKQQDAYLCWISALPFATISDLHVSTAQTAVIYLAITTFTMITYSYRRQSGLPDR